MHTPITSFKNYLNKNKRMRFYAFALTSFYAMIPVITFAAPNIGTLLVGIRNTVFDLIPLVIALAVIFFFWGLAMFILHAGDEARRSQGKQIMIWGIVALFVIVAVWGLVAVLATTFGVTTGGTGSVNIPTIQ